MPVTATELQRRARSPATRTRPASRSPGSGRPRSPTARPTRAGSPLPGPRIFLNTLSDGESESGAEFLGASDRRPRRRRRQGRARSGARASTSTNAAKRGCSTTATASPRVVAVQRQRASKPRSSLGSAVHRLAARARRAELASGSVMNPEGGGVSAWPSSDPHGRPGGRRARGLPQRGRADGAGQRRRRRADRRTGGRPLGAGRRPRGLPAGPGRRRRDRRRAGDRAAGRRSW